MWNWYLPTNIITNFNLENSTSSHIARARATGTDTDCKDITCLYFVNVRLVTFAKYIPAEDGEKYDDGQRILHSPKHGKHKHIS